ncbi:phage baseplate protein [Streptomyces atratus]|uniref:phage baseplate protein n=1 Tax=Streptomyces atratus TaxID=1893 RepID=UPI0033D3EA05
MTERASLAAAGKPWIRNGRLHHVTVLQSFAFDERRGHVYALQVMQGGTQLPGEKRIYGRAERAARGDLCLNRLTMSGVLTGYMYLKGFGHGGALGVEASQRGSGMLWTEWDANPASGYGRGICRFRFVDGRVLTRSSGDLATYRPVPGSTSNHVALDQANRRLLLRYKVRGVPRFAVHDFQRFAAHDFRPLADFPQPGTGLGLPFQGMTLHGDHAYQMFGTGYGPENPRSSAGNTCLFGIDWRTGRVEQQSLDRTAPGLYPREPEGLAVLREGGPWLCMGFTQGPSGGRGFSLYYKAIV